MDNEADCMVGFPSFTSLSGSFRSSQDFTALAFPLLSFTSYALLPKFCLLFFAAPITSFHNLYNNDYLIVRLSKDVMEKTVLCVLFCH